MSLVFDDSTVEEIIAEIKLRTGSPRVAALCDALTTSIDSFETFVREMDGKTGENNEDSIHNMLGEVKSNLRDAI